MTIFERGMESLQNINMETVVSTAEKINAGAAAMLHGGIQLLTDVGGRLLQEGGGGEVSQGLLVGGALLLAIGFGIGFAAERRFRRSNSSDSLGPYNYDSKAADPEFPSAKEDFFNAFNR